MTCILWQTAYIPNGILFHTYCFLKLLLSCGQSYELFSFPPNRITQNVLHSLLVDILFGAVFLDDEVVDDEVLALHRVLAHIVFQ